MQCTTTTTTVQLPTVAADAVYQRWTQLSGVLEHARAGGSVGNTTTAFAFDFALFASNIRAPRNLH